MTLERDGAGTASVTGQMTEWTLSKQLDWGEEWVTYCGGVAEGGKWREVLRSLEMKRR